MGSSRIRPGHRGVATALASSALLSLVLAAPAFANHTHGTLDCGENGTYLTEPASEVDPQPFEAPVPGSGVLRLQGTTMLFKAFAIQTSLWSFSRAQSGNLDLVTCTLSSSGLNFGSPWTLQGIFVAG